MGVSIGEYKIFFGNKREIDQTIREKVGQQKTRDRVGGRKRVIGEKMIRRKER